MKMRDTFFLLVALLFSCENKTGENGYVFKSTHQSSPKALIDSTFVSAEDSLKVFIKKYWPNGKIASEGYMQGGEMNGSFLMYNDSGRVTYQAEYDHGKLIKEEFK